MGGRALEPLPRQDPARFEGCSRTGTPYSSARHRKGDPTLPSTSLMPLVPLLMGFTEPLPCFRVSPRDVWFPPRHGAGGMSPRSEWGPRCASPHREMGAQGGWVRDAPRVPHSPRHAAIAMATQHPTGPKRGREGGRRPAGGSCRHEARRAPGGQAPGIAPTPTPGQGEARRAAARRPQPLSVTPGRDIYTGRTKGP